MCVKRPEPFQDKTGSAGERCLACGYLNCKCPKPEPKPGDKK